jgi:anti-sigma factor RsiW
MSKLPERHASEEQLLRLADGELPAREASLMRRHLEACWQCRTEFEEIQKVIGQCVRHRKAALEAHLPPPAPWGDIYRQFERIDREMARPPLWARMWSFAVAPSVWAPVALGLLLIMALYVRFDQAPAVEAAELLKKAVATAEVKPAPPQRIQIRTSKQRLTRVIGRRVSGAQARTEAELEGMFRSARYSWEEPLSARSFQVWRDGLADKQDEVSLVRWADQSCYQIRTISGGGDLAAATLKLRAGDLRPVESTLEFRNREWVEITELPAESVPAQVAAVGSPAVERQIPAPAPAPAVLATAADELQVLAALHEIGADLGDPVEVVREGGQVLVTGVGIAAGRRQEIETALNTLPRVVMRFSGPPQGEAAPTPGGMIRMEAEADRRAAEVLEEYDAMMARVYALRRLADRFPPGVETELGAAEKMVLRSLRQEHAGEIARRTARIERLLTPAFFSTDARAAPARPPDLPREWQPAAEELFRTARRVEKLLGAALGGAAAEIPQEAIPGQVVSGMAELRSAAEAYHLDTRGR